MGRNRQDTYRTQDVYRLNDKRSPAAWAKTFSSLSVYLLASWFIALNVCSSDPPAGFTLWWWQKEMAAGMTAVRVICVFNLWNYCNEKWHFAVKKWTKILNIQKFLRNRTSDKMNLIWWILKKYPVISHISGIFEYYTQFIYMIVYFTMCLILNVSTADVAF